MSFRFPRGAALAALIASMLVAVPACKKPKPTQPDSPNPGPGPGPGPNPGAGGRDAAAPRSPVFTPPQDVGMRTGAKANLMQIVLALHNYEQTYQTLPGGYADKTGKPGSSWRVAILPFVEAQNLHKQFKLGEPWDSEHNKKLISQMPKVFAPPRTETNGYTFYRGFSGPGTWLGPLNQQKHQPGQPIRAARLTSITDGTVNTILVAEAYDPVIWTKPDELEFSPNNVPKLGGVFSTGAHVGMADGSPKFVRNGIEPQKLAAAIQINDGGLVNLDD
jgi:hypothetical protein